MGQIDFNGKRALVTGGSTGIGRELALQLAALGAQVVIVARDRLRAEQVVAFGAGNIVHVQADLSEPSEQARLVEQVHRDWPDLRILINNAGVQVNLPPMSVGDSEQIGAMRAEVQLNLMAPIALSFGLMPLLASQPAAVIVNVSSGLALAPKRSAPVYCATKAALRSFTGTLRYRCEDWAPGIRVIDAIMPLVDTDMTRGRGSGKISAATAARAVIDGVIGTGSEIWIGKARLLRCVHAFAPRLARRLFRNR